MTVRSRDFADGVHELRLADPDRRNPLGFAMLAALRDAIDVAFTIGNNDHPEYGGLELSLRDFQIPVR